MLFGLLPPFADAALLVCGGVLLAIGAGWIAGDLKLRRGLATAYSRKLFHFVIFTAATVLHALGGWPFVNAFALGVVFMVLLAVWRGDGFVLYEPLARERDAPHRSFFIIVPLVTTALGGLSSNLLAGNFALVGYLVTGWGDAVGEPVGRWIGRHPYRVPTLLGVKTDRTAEGSIAVGVAAFLACLFALTLGLGVPGGIAVGTALGVAVATVAVEAVSPHGTDNFTTMLGASLIAAAMAG